MLLTASRLPRIPIILAIFCRSWRRAVFRSPNRKYARPPLSEQYRAIRRVILEMSIQHLRDTCLKSHYRVDGTGTIIRVVGAVAFVNQAKKNIYVSSQHCRRDADATWPHLCGVPSPVHLWSGYIFKYIIYTFHAK